MKNCPNCQMEIEENFDACWNCSYSLTENRIPETEEMPQNGPKVDCLRCRIPMVFSGTLRLHEGARIGFFGNFWEAFVKRKAFDIAVCPTCRKVEFYLPDGK